MLNYTHEFYSHQTKMQLIYLFGLVVFSLRTVSASHTNIQNTLDVYNKYKHLFQTTGELNFDHVKSVVSALFRHNPINANKKCLLDALENEAFIDNLNVVKPKQLEKMSAAIFCHLARGPRDVCSPFDHQKCLDFIENFSTNKSKAVSTFKETGLVFGDRAPSACLDVGTILRNLHFDANNHAHRLEDGGKKSIEQAANQVVNELYEHVLNDCVLPDSNWFIEKIFNFKKTIGLDDLLENLGIENEPKKRASSSRCFTKGQLKKIYSLNETLHQYEFQDLCPGLIFLKMNSACYLNDNSTIREQSATVAEKYGYGTLAIISITLLAMIGIFLLPLFSKSIYEGVLVYLSGLAVSTLFCDAMLHILPEVLRFDHDIHESSKEEIQVPAYILRISIVILTLYFFWLFEMLVHRFSTNESIPNLHGHSHAVLSGLKHSAQKYLEHNSARENSFDWQENVNSSSGKAKPKLDLSLFKNIKSTVWVIIVSDALHNFADGLAVGASFSDSLKMGLSTSVAVICHEIPHELGNYAILIKSGMSHNRALSLNILSALCGFIGFYVGISIAAEAQIGSWILTITAGMFVYVSLVDLLPNLFPNQKWTLKAFFLVNFALLSGFLIMFLLVVFETNVQLF